MSFACRFGLARPLGLRQGRERRQRGQRCQRRRHVGDDAAFLIDRDDQRRKPRRASQRLQARDFRFQVIRRTPFDIVPGDIDSADQSLRGQWRDLVEGCVSGDEMPAQFPRGIAVRAQHRVLMQMERRDRRPHRQRRQAPCQDKQFRGNSAASPISAPQQRGDPDKFGNQQRDVASTSDRYQIRIVEIVADENENGRQQPKQDRRDALEHSERPLCLRANQAGQF